MADVYYNHDESLSVELENVDEVILFRNVLEASVGRTQTDADYKIIQHIIDELTEHIIQETLEDWTMKISDKQELY